MGVLEAIEFDDKQKPQLLYVRFDDPTLRDQLIEIGRVSAPFESAPGVVKVRRQFPLTPAFAITIHKSQGQTMDNVLMQVRTAFCANMTFELVKF